MPSFIAICFAFLQAKKNGFAAVRFQVFFARLCEKIAPPAPYALFSAPVLYDCKRARACADVRRVPLLCRLRERFARMRILCKPRKLHYRAFRVGDFHHRAVAFERFARAAEIRHVRSVDNRHSEGCAVNRCLSATLGGRLLPTNAKSAICVKLRSSPVVSAR